MVLNHINLKFPIPPSMIINRKIDDYNEEKSKNENCKVLTKVHHIVVTHMDRKQPCDPRCLSGVGSPT